MARVNKLISRGRSGTFDKDIISRASKRKGKKSNLPKLCLRCKIALQEVIKSVWKCPMCKTIINDRLKDLAWKTPIKTIT